MVATGKTSELFKALAIGAILMILGGVAEILFGVKAERMALERIAKPLTAVESGREIREVRGTCLAGRSLHEPAPEDIDSIRRPRTVAGHRPVFQPSEDRGRVLADVVMRPEVEVRPHGVAVALTEERLDVGRVADCVTFAGYGHVGLLFRRLVDGRSPRSPGRGS